MPQIARGDEMISLFALFVLAALLFLKHFVADGPLQSAAQVRNKGVFLHPDGISHAVIHAGLSAIAIAAWAFALGVDLVSFSGGVTAVLALLAAEVVVHYAIDFSKCQVDRRFGWASRPAQPAEAYLVIHDPRFFYSFLADQLAHSLTYVAMLFAIARMGGVAP